MTENHSEYPHRLTRKLYIVRNDSLANILSLKIYCVYCLKVKSLGCTLPLVVWLHFGQWNAVRSFKVTHGR